MSVTNPDLAIIRLHGRRVDTWESRHEDVAERFRYLYSGEQLTAWLETFSRTIDEARRVHLTFNNNKWNYATTNAVEMNAIVAGQFFHRTGTQGVLTGGCGLEVRESLHSGIFHTCKPASIPAS